MKILLVEDTESKAEQIMQVLQKIDGIEKMVIQQVDNKDECLDLLELYEDDPVRNDISHIILDMSLPQQKGDTDIKHLAGKDILIFMRHSQLSIPTIVLTGHDVFGEQETFIGLEQLKKELEKRYANFLKGVVYWDNNQGTQEILTQFIKEQRC